MQACWLRAHSTADVLRMSGTRRTDYAHAHASRALDLRCNASHVLALHISGDRGRARSTLLTIGAASSGGICRENAANDTDLDTAQFMWLAARTEASDSALQLDRSAS
jgi:hypothetical protein